MSIPTDAEIEQMSEWASLVAWNDARFNAATRERAQGVYEALEWVRGHQDPPYSKEDVE